MATTDYIPRRYLELAVFVANLLNKASFSQSRLGILAADLAAYQMAVNEYLAANTAASGPDASSADLQNRKALAKAVVAATREFVNFNLRYNHAMTDSDRTEMGLTIPDRTPTPVPVPTTFPVFKADTSKTIRIVLNIHDSQSEKRGKPNGVHGCEIRWAILDNPPTGIEDLVHSAFTTKASYTFDFDLPQQGKRLYFCGHWENTKGEKGPWSPVQNTIIP